MIDGIDQIWVPPIKTVRVQIRLLRWVVPVRVAFSVEIQITTSESMLVQDQVGTTRPMKTAHAHEVLDQEEARKRLTGDRAVHLVNGSAP